MASFCSGTWNTRGLCAKCDKARGKKLAHAEKLINQTDFAAFQETHGSAAVLTNLLHKHKGDRHVSWSSFDSPEAMTLDMQSIPLGAQSGRFPSEKDSTLDKNCNHFCAAGDSATYGNDQSNNSDSDVSSNISYGSYDSCKSSHSYSSSVSSSCSTRVGGVLNILSKKAFPSGTTFCSKSIVQGRCLETIAEVGGSTSVFINVHFLIGPLKILGPLLIEFPFITIVPLTTPCTTLSAFWEILTLDMRTKLYLMLPLGKPCSRSPSMPNQPNNLNKF